VNIEVIDKAIPLELLDKYNNLEIAVTRNRSDDGENFYTTFVEYGSNYDVHGQTVINNFLHGEAKDIWEWFKSKTDVQDSNLNSCYINTMTFGDEGFTHIDGEVEDNVITCIIYMNPEWHSQWGGETVFYGGEFTDDFGDSWYYNHDIVKSVLPRYGRAVIFDGHIPHSARSISKKCYMERKTLMFKLVNTNFEGLKKGLINATT
jgi:SM-20-related protein